MGARTVEISLPHTGYAVAAYYLIATAEASANLARYDGMRYGLRAAADNNIELYNRTRAQGFGAEVKRRIMLGTFALSAGYYDAYYLKGQKVRTLIRRDFERAFESCDLIAAPVAPTTAFRLGEKTADPLQDVSVRYFHHLGEPRRAARDVGAVRRRRVAAADRTATDRPAVRRGGDPARGRRMGTRGRLHAAVAAALERRRNRISQAMNNDAYEMVIGLEVHAHMLTRSKLFCGCSTDFGAPPNHNVCPVCMAMPGVLPVLNRHVLELAIRTGLAAHCKIEPHSVFARKSYFYPDLPKGYQISQYDQPLCSGGYIELPARDEQRAQANPARANPSRRGCRQEYPCREREPGGLSTALACR